MKKLTSRFIGFIKKHKILSIIVGFIILILCSWWAVVNFIPHPLGTKLEYLGKKDYGCWVGFCDSRPASTYYYGTDMSKEEIVAYFKKSTQLQAPFLEDGKMTINIRTQNGETAYIYYYPSSDLESFKTKKPYIVEIPSFKYDAIRESL